MNAYPINITKNSRIKNLKSSNYKIGKGFDFFKVDTKFKLVGSFFNIGMENQIAGIWNLFNTTCWLNACLQFLRILDSESSKNLFDPKLKKILEKLKICKEWFKNYDMYQYLVNKNIIPNSAIQKGYDCDVILNQIIGEFDIFTINRESLYNCKKCNKNFCDNETLQGFNMVQFQTDWEKCIFQNLHPLKNCLNCKKILEPCVHSKYNFGEFILLKNDDLDDKSIRDFERNSKKCKLIAATGYFLDENKNGHWAVLILNIIFS